MRSKSLHPHEKELVAILKNTCCAADTHKPVAQWYKKTYLLPKTADAAFIHYRLVRLLAAIVQKRSLLSVEMVIQLSLGNAISQVWALPTAETLVESWDLILRTVIINADIDSLGMTAKDFKKGDNNA